MLRKTIFFLIVLRLAIGWHFFFEGWHKFHSTHVGQTETSRPFSSAGYWQNAPGPAGPITRGYLGADPDEAAQARFNLQQAAAGKADPADRLTPALAAEIDDYLARFLKAFNLDDAEKKAAEAKAKEAKGKIAVYLSTSITLGQPLTEYQGKLAELNKLTADRSIMLGRDADNKRIMDIKADVAKARKSALDELDKELGKVLRDELAGVVKKKMAAVKLTAVAGPDAFAELLPEVRDGRWYEYLAAFKFTYPLTESQLQTAETKFNTAKALTAEWLAGKQAIPASVVVGHLASSQPSALGATLSLIAVREGLVGAAREQNEQMKRYLNAALTDDQAKGYPPAVKPEPSPFLHWIDTLTTYGLLAMGCCLLLGLLTRINCVLAAGFLVMTYLAYPPFPWLPSPPNNEGSYLFVNKNLVELLALLVLATVPTGRWFGIDAVLHWFFARKKSTKNLAFVKKAA